MAGVAGQHQGREGGPIGQPDSQGASPQHVGAGHDKPIGMPYGARPRTAPTVKHLDETLPHHLHDRGQLPIELLQHRGHPSLRVLP